MVDVRGDVLRPPHGTTPAAVKSNIKSEMRSFKSNENLLLLMTQRVLSQNASSHIEDILRKWIYSISICVEN